MIPKEDRYFVKPWSRGLPVRTICLDGEEYMRRYYVFGQRPPGLPRSYIKLGWLPFAVYLHEFLISDPDRDLHNHPMNAVSLILRGSYREESYASPYTTDIVQRVYSPGRLNFITRDLYHRIQLLDDKVWTLFVAGTREGEWGFKLRSTGEWVHHREYLKREAA